MKNLLLSLLLLTINASAANVYTCADATQVGKLPWPATGGCVSTAYVPAGPGLIVATAAPDWSVQSWKTSATIAPADHVFTDTKDAAGSAWALGSAFTWGSPVLGSVTLTWVAPVLTWDDKPLTVGLKNFQLYSAASGSPLTKYGVPLDPTLTTYTVTGLAPGNYDFAITSITNQDIEAAFSNIVTRAPTVPKETPKPMVLK